MHPAITLLALALFLQTPDATLPPATAHLKLTAEGLGVQTYSCNADAASFHWVFIAPEATLFDPATHQPIGKHGAGPTWEFNDGSAITGKLLKTTSAPAAANIPWLLLETHSTGTDGALSNITLVRVPYEATYTFYTTN